mgnify:FL=1
MNKRLVIVTLTDANTDSEDVVNDDSIDRLHKPTIVHTLGWVMRDDDVGITVCTEYYDHAFRGRTIIPRVCINSVTDYKLSKPPKPRKPKSKPNGDVRAGTRTDISPGGKEPSE